MTLSPIKGSLAAVLGLATCLAASARAANIVSDGGFESATANSCTSILNTTYTGSIGDGWTVTAGSIQICPASNGVVPFDGSQFAYLDDGYTANTLSQTLTTVVGQAYTISFWIADTPPDPDTVVVLFGSQSVYNGDAPTNGVSSASDYEQVQATLTALSTSTVLSITGQWDPSDGAFGTLLDDVSVTPVGSTPEPATVAATGLGCLALLAVGGLRRRRSHRWMA